MKKHIAILAVVSLAGAVIACFESTTGPSSTPGQSASGQSGNCNVQGNGNTVNCSTAAPSPSPSVTPTKCVAQLAPFACGPGTAFYAADVSKFQANLAAAPEPIYVARLIEEINKSKDFCAAAVPGASDEIAIKAGNDRSETYDVVRADGAIQTLFVNVCSPARF